MSGARLTAADVEECLAAIDDVVAAETIPAETLRELGECLASPRKRIQRRAAEAFAAWVGQDDAVRAALVTLLQAATLRQRWGAAYALSLAGPPPCEVLPVLLECLGVDDGDVRWAAAEILLRLRDAVGLDEPLCGLVRSGNPAQRKMAIYCLRDLEAGSPAARQLVLAALDDDETGVRLAAMAYLARLASPPGVAAERIVARLEDADPGVRRAAAALLGGLGHDSEVVMAALRAAAVSPDASLQRAAQASLRRLQGEKR